MQNVNDMIKQNEDYVLEQICTKYFLKRSNLSPHGIEKKITYMKSLIGI